MKELLHLFVKQLLYVRLNKKEKVMKKAFLFVIMTALLFCLFVISVSAVTITNIDGETLEVTTYEDAPARTKITISTDDVVVFNDGFVCPSAYVFKDSTYLEQKANMFDFSYIKGKTDKTYTYEDIVEVDIPQGVTSTSTYTFASHPALRRVSLPNTLTSIGNCFFEKVSTLEECVFEHKENSGLETIPSWMFANCTSLKAISFPDCVKYMKGNHQLGGCTNLTAIYLSKNLISTEGGNNGDGTFAHLAKGYFVNTPFTYDNIPEKPEIYYFPANYYTMTGEAFDTSTNLNRILVFRADNIDITVNGYTFEKATCDSNGTKPIIVFTGNVDKLSVGGWNVEKIYFANENDKSSSDITLTGSKSFVFCHADGNTTHLAEKVVDIEASCEVDAVKVTYCFCGCEMSKETVENSALGHDYREENKIYTFGSIYAQATSCMTCTRECGINSEAVSEGYVLADMGYSCCEYNNKVGISRTFNINKELLAEFEKVNGGVEIGFGITPYVENAPTPSILEDFAISEALKKENDEPLYSTINFIVTYGSDMYKDALIYIAGYAKVNGKIEFVDGAFNTISYNSIFELTK